MIDQEQIERILQEVKITSISDIVSFITSYVSKTALQPLEDLEERVSWLENPKGMDRVMIEEVKALVEAMLDQREEVIHKQIDRKCRENVCNSFDMPENSRRSLNEIDFINIMNMQKGTQSQQLRKNSTNAYPSLRVDTLASQLREVREEIMNKPERKELQQIKMAVFKIDKELVSKVTFDQTQKLILKFERDIFMRLNENKGKYQEIESKVMHKIHEEMQKVASSFEQSLKGKSSIKLQKKLKHYGQEISFMQSRIEKIDKSASEKHRNCLQNFDNLQSLVSQLSDEKSQLLLSQNRKEQCSFNHAFWMSSPPTYKNSQVVWQRQLFNNDAANLEFQSGKTGIRLISAGFYEISCAIYGGNGSLKKGPSLMCNSQPIGRLETCTSSSQSLPRWRFREYVHIRQNRSTFTIRLDSEQNSSCIILMIRKVSY